MASTQTDASGVTHAITLRGVQLTAQILEGTKPVENRHFRIKPGWVALHNGAGDKPTSASIVGLARFEYGIPIELVSADLPEHLKMHCTGPLCNVVGAVLPLLNPVRNVKGRLGMWPMADDVRNRVLAELPQQAGPQETGFPVYWFSRPTHRMVEDLRVSKRQRRVS